MRSTLTRLATIVGVLLAVSAFGSVETVKYPGMAGFDSITYTSEFFGYQSGVNRDFTNYGQGFAAPVEHEPGWKVPKAITDFNGDDLPDKWSFDAGTGKLSISYGKPGGQFATPVPAKWHSDGKPCTLVAADFNGDRYCDIALYGSSAYPKGFLFLFGRGDGMFGPTEAEKKTTAATHLSATFPWPIPHGAIAIAGQFDDDGTADIGAYDPKTEKVITRVQVSDPAYDYSVHLVKDGSVYKMWHGGRWRTLDKDGKVLPAADGDHVMYAWSPDGHKWFRKIDGPAFPKGDEIGIHAWWSNNYLEPEVLKVKGTYYMFWQAEIDPGSTVDNGEKAVSQCDRIGLSTSVDGVNWKRKTDRGVIINIPNPTITNIDHQEAIYVPDDKDGKPWWLYTFHFIDGQPAGHVRIRSNDPTTFDWSAREPVSGMSQIGNQIGYADEAPGGRMFFRITFAGNGQERNVPTLQISRDGLNWVTGQEGGLARPLLAGSKDDKDNRNCYFLGMSTIDGTGKMECVGKNKFRAFYGATTSNGPGQPGIWRSEIGVGQVFITFNRAAK